MTLRDVGRVLLLRPALAPGPKDPAYYRRIVIAGAAALAVTLAVIRLFPHAPLARQIPLSTAVWSADGELLRVTRSTDDQYRMWVPLSGISPAFVDAVLLKEDRWFYWHPGANPAALVRGAFRTYVGGTRQGGSTVTMQLARLLYRLNTRTAVGKVRQIGTALWLEARYSCLLYTSPSPRDRQKSRMPSSA